MADGYLLASGTRTVLQPGIRGWTLYLLPISLVFTLLGMERFFVDVQLFCNARSHR